MKELDLQDKYLVNFFTERPDGLRYKEVKANTVSAQFFVLEDLKHFISNTTLNKDNYRKLLRKFSSEKELLEKYKKGIMQAIFSQKIRFNDENRESFPDWKEKKLGDIGEIRTGKTPSTLNKSLWDGDILFVTPTDMVEGVKYQVTAARTVNASNGRVLPAKTIMYTCIASIGKMALSTKPTITNQQINSLILTGEFDKEFVYYTLLWMTPKIQATQANNTLPIINKTDFSKFKIPTPSINEQQKIVDFLSAIDEKIELTERKLEQAKKFKKALLQQMFV